MKNSSPNIPLCVLQLQIFKLWWEMSWLTHFSTVRLSFKFLEFLRRIWVCSVPKKVPRLFFNIVRIYSFPFRHVIIMLHALAKPSIGFSWFYRLAIKLFFSFDWVWITFGLFNFTFRHLVFWVFMFTYQKLRFLKLMLSKTFQK